MEGSESVKWQRNNVSKGPQRPLRTLGHIVTETQSNGNGKEQILTMFHFQIERF